LSSWPRGKNKGDNDESGRSFQSWARRGHRQDGLVGQQQSNTPQTFNVLHADMLAQAKGMELYARIFMAAPDGSSLYICALTASKLAWAA
jgi:hypothetical protein